MRPSRLPAVLALAATASSWAGEGTTAERIALSADGGIVVTASDGEIRVRSVPEDRELRVIPGGKDLTSVAVSAEGGKVASGHADGSVRIWDAASGKALMPDPWNRKEAVVSVALSRDGKAAACLRRDGSLDGWAAGGRQFRLRMREGTGTAGFSPDGGHLLSGGGGAALTLLESGTGRIVWKTVKPVQAAAFSPDGKALAFCSEGEVCLCRLPVCTEGSRFPAPAGGISALSFLGDGKVLAFGTCEGGIVLQDAESGKESGRMGGKAPAIVRLQSLPGGRFLASVDASGKALLWDLLTLSRTVEASAESVPLKDGELRALWDSLLGPDGSKAVRTLAVSPAAVVPFLRERLQPVLEDAGRYDRLIRDLDDDRYDVREKAYGELALLGPMAEPALRRAAASPSSEEVRSRVEALLEILSSPAAAPLEGEALRNTRALQLLELIGTQEARELLQAMASGAEGARETREARAALERMARRK